MRATTDGPWLWVNRRAFELAAQEGASVALTLVAMAFLESRAPRGCKGGFPASLDEIASVSGLSKRTIQTALQVLVKIGLLRVFSGCNKQGAAVRNRYCLEAVLDPITDGNGCHGGVAMVARGGGNGYHATDGNGCHPNKEKEEEGRPPSGPTRPSSKKETQTPPVEASVRLDAAPGSTPPEKTDTVLGDGEDPQWEAYVAQQRGLMAMREQRLAEGSLGW